MDWILLVKEHIANIGIPLEVFFFAISMFLAFRNFFWFLGLCKPSYCAGGGFTAVAVAVTGDR